MRRPLLIALILTMANAAPATSQDQTAITGKWLCEYGVRKLSSAQQSSAAWFEVNFTEKGRFHGGGKAIAAGSALPMTLRGAWALDDDGVLKMTGVSDVANQKVPFRFVSDRTGPDRFKRHEVKSGTEYRTGCKRSD